MTEAKHFRADGSMTPNALAKLEQMAAQNKSQGSLAAFFGVPRRSFEGLLSKNKGNNPERLAWERGRAIVEQDLMDRLYKGAMGAVEVEYRDDEPVVDKAGLPVLGDDGKPLTERVKVRTIHLSKSNTIEAIFFAKAQFGWKEGDSEEKKVSNVMLVLPKARTRAEYFAMLGIPDPMQIAAGEPMKVIQQVPLAPKALAGPLAALAPLAKAVMGPPDGGAK